MAPAHGPSSWPQPMARVPGPSSWLQFVAPVRGPSSWPQFMARAHGPGAVRRLLDPAEAPGKRQGLSPTLRNPHLRRWHSERFPHNFQGLQTGEYLFRAPLQWRPIALHVKQGALGDSLAARPARPMCPDPDHANRGLFSQERAACAGTDVPQFTFDAGAGRLIAANAAGWRAWGCEPPSVATPVVLDAAMPALERLREFLRGGV